MITDKETNFVYFSELFKEQYKNEYSEITSFLDKHGVNHDCLLETKDIWCRDYMPIQILETEFVEYRYDPDYLQGKKYRKKKTYPDIVCDKIELKTIKSDLIIDGGNIIKSKNRIILTDKVISENIESYNETEIISKLKNTFRVDKVSIIPREPDKKEIFGHADGMIRFVDDNRVLINGYFQEYDKKFKDKFFNALNGLDIIELNFTVRYPNEEINWGYINFLQTEQVILLPQFGIDEDEQAYEQFVRIFPEYANYNRIKKVNAKKIINDGSGVLNCLSWNIKL